MPRHGGFPPGTPAPRPRYRRIAAAAASCAVTTVAVLGGVGLFPTGETPVAYAAPAVRGAAAPAGGTIQLTGSVSASLPLEPRGVLSESLPPSSGTGQRVVFGIAAQRVWLVSAGDQVLRTYLVSGSVTDNLEPGSYAVYSRSRWAVGVDDSGVMRYMVRFAHGRNAAIGFHDIPTRLGQPLQTRAELGTPQSHGCIRQRRADAKALWAFAPVGTPVVVLA